MAKKRIIVCCDGTWNQPFQEGGSTNVAKTVRAIRPSDDAGVPQIVYYDPGVGTGNWFDRLVGGGLGVGLSQNVQDGYLFIVANYQPGDEIYLFGFSRGAYTVRSLAGLIGAVGILYKSLLARFPAAYAYYRTPSVNRNGELKTGLLPAKRHENVPVKFLGVWDTVGALGIPGGPLRWASKWRYSFHDVDLGKHIRHAYHALAIDERRRSFEPSIWKKVADAEQKVEQVWFCGAHSNVGGGYENTGLSDIAWKWMLEKASGCDLALDREYIDNATRSEPPTVLYDSRRSWKWKFRRPLVREVLATHLESERIHPSVLECMGHKDREQFDPLPYAPVNLAAAERRLKAKGQELSRYVAGWAGGQGFAPPSPSRGPAGQGDAGAAAPGALQPSPAE